MRIFISGVHSGPNPSPGIGIARSLRNAFPNLHLIGVDYSNTSSGIHSDLFDSILLQPSWNDLNLNHFAESIKEMLDDSDVWFSGLDLEVLCLSSQNTNNILVPPPNALREIRKPNINIHKHLSLNIPPFIPISASDQELYSFCSIHNWSVWIKGPYYEAIKVRSWAEFVEKKYILQETWSKNELFIQAHIAGYEESIAFSAYKGEMIGCVYMNKRMITNEGKTWAGSISKVPDTICDSLKKTIKILNWTGGAEIECVRDKNNELWIIDWNPRFPAWIYGATIAGVNLPAMLISAINGEALPEYSIKPQEFTRIVIEIPTREDFPLPNLTESNSSSFGWISKHPSGMPNLARKMSDTHNDSLSNDNLYTYDINIPDDVITPTYYVINNIVENNIRNIKNETEAITTDSGVTLNVAYSIKTSPFPEYINKSLYFGFYAEAISQLELRYAESLGFPLEKIILNGPGKYWPNYSTDVIDKTKIIFCDSLNEIKNISSQLSRDSILGLRIRPPLLNSRFGIPVEEPLDYRMLIDLINKIPQQRLGLHFHMASSVIGVERWWKLFEIMVSWAESIQYYTRKNFEILDIGGGWNPEDLNHFCLPRMRLALLKSKQKLSSLQECIIEPGKALTQNTACFVVTILDIRKLSNDYREIIVDGAISDIPLVNNHPHQILLKKSGQECYIMNRGNDRIFGRICMENDILADGITLPQQASPGDRIIFLNAGAYDRSMAYAFGRGQ